jgi:hypothetical protein
MFKLNKEQNMFISRNEKENIEMRLMTLEAMVKSLYEKQRIKREKAIEASKKYHEKHRSATRKGWTPESKAIQSERMKLMWATRKAQA